MKDDATEISALAFLKETVAACPFRLTHVLTDHGSCFTERFSAACRAEGNAYRRTKPYMPQTNGIVERFNGRIDREVLVITVGTHADLETLLTGYNHAYNARPQRVLAGKSSDHIVQAHLADAPSLGNPRFKPPDPMAPAKALATVASAKEVSQPDRRAPSATSWSTTAASLSPPE